ncbi:unnamed protein product [Amoebophrya sp. A120]|nr:unnamed protein product [Amoebophrya sp. A120]|eukprot:GSA120T00008346001.1
MDHFFFRSSSRAVAGAVACTLEFLLLWLLPRNLEASVQLSFYHRSPLLLCAFFKFCECVSTQRDNPKDVQYVNAEKQGSALYTKKRLELLLPVYCELICSNFVKIIVIIY